MFAGDTKNKQRSGQPVKDSWQPANRNAQAQQHSTAETVTGQHQVRYRPRILLGGSGGGTSGAVWI